MIPEIKKQITEIKEKDPITHRIIACAYKVHSELGPGFNERIYHNSLELELRKERLRFETEKHYSVFYEDKQVGILKV